MDSTGLRLVVLSDQVDEVDEVDEEWLRDQWLRLVDALDAWTRATALAPGQIEVWVGPADSRRRVVIRMAPDEWSDMAGVMWGDFDDAVTDVMETLERLKPDQDMLVYSQYRLEPYNWP